MAIIGAHMLLYSAEADALRATLRDVFGFPSVDAGGGWLIFALPPAELGVHPAEGSQYEAGGRHQVSFMCDDIRATIAELGAKGIQIEGQPKDESFGTTVMMTLPGGVKVMLYQPRHAMAITPSKRIAAS
ncbi:MAG TPA: VOC family protein [Candidatus Acidoferrales bacterium]|nr:VOC family protein [Candidatus Acidoferrales bacterium]